MPVEVFTVVTDEGMYVGAGLVSRWFTRIGEQMHINTVNAAPVRTGQLVGGITLGFTHSSLRIINCYVSSTAPHTKYVLFGTAGDGVGLIYSRRGWRNRATVGRIRNARDSGGRFRQDGDTPIGLWMKLSDATNGYHLTVHGQRHNNFLLKGYAQTSRTHRSLRPILPGIGRSTL